MSLFDVPISTANSVYNLSVVVLAGGIALVLISMLSMLWSSVVKQRYTTQQMAQNAAAVAQANIALLKAKEDATTATHLLNEVKAAAAELAKQREQAAVPAGRQITPERRELFRLFVKDFSKGRIIVGCATTDVEAINYTKQIGDMLTNAGYIVVPLSAPSIPVQNSTQGVHIRIRSMSQQPTYAGSLQKGLEYIGVDTAGELDDAAQDAVLVLVGSKP